MSFLSGLFNGAQGANFQAQSANIVQPTNQQQIQGAYQGAQSGLNQQQAFANAVAGMNGLGNLSNVYNQYANIASGQGPNPAQTMLNQATGQNVANQAALMAGQRGSGANVGLMARQAAQQGAATQQQAVGQGATMQAQQQLGALGQMSGIAGQQAGLQANALQNLNQMQQNEQQNLLNAQAQANAANVAMQSNMNSTNAAIAQGNQAFQGNMFGGLMNGLSAGASALLNKGGKVKKMGDGGAVTMFDDGGMATTNNMPNAMPASTTPQPMAGGPQSTVGQILKGSFQASPGNQSANKQQLLGQSNWTQGTGYGGYKAGNAVGSTLGKGLQSIFGKSTPNSDSTAEVPVTNVTSQQYPAEGEDESLPSPTQENQSGVGQEYSATENDYKGGKTGYAKGGKVPAMLSPGEKYLNPKQAKAVAQGKASPMIGKTVPGKAKVKGDSLKNDTVPATLREGGVVIPRSIMESNNPEGHAARFVAAVMKSSSLKKNKG